MARRLVSPAALLAIALLFVAGASASQHPTRTVTTTGEIEAIAMEGPVVAYDVGARANVGQPCNRLYLWNLKTRKRKQIGRGRFTCQADDTSTGAGVAEVAVAGKRAASIVNDGGNTEMVDYLFTAT
jgi:hypothetical protein